MSISKRQSVNNIYKVPGFATKNYYCLIIKGGSNGPRFNILSRAREAGSPVKPGAAAPTRHGP